MPDRPVHPRDRLPGMVLGIACILYIALLPVMPLMEPDEGRYSLIPHEMNVAGDYVTPRLKGVAYFEKPPLCYWATALAFKVFGATPFAARLFTGLCAGGCILLAYRMGRYLHGRRTGVYAAALLSTSLFPFALGRVSVLDMPLAFFVTLAVWSGFRALNDEPRRKRPLYGLYAASALAFLTKGLIGIVFPFAILILWAACLRRGRDILRLISPVGIGILLVLAGPWLILVQRANPDFFWFFFVQEHFLRYTTTMHARYQPFYYFIPIAIAGIMPWLGFLPEACGRVRFQTLFERKEQLFFAVWAGFIFVFFSASSSKLIPYIAPIFPPLAVMLGHVFRTYDEAPAARPGNPARELVPAALQSLVFIGVLLVPLFSPRYHIPPAQWWPWVVMPLTAAVVLVFLPRLVRQRTGRGWFATAYLLAALLLAGLVFPFGRVVAPQRSAYPTAQAVARLVPAGAELYQYRVCAYGIDFYTGRRTPVVGDFGELRFGIGRLGEGERRRYFLSPTEFERMIRNRAETYCITDDPDRVAQLRHGVVEVLWRNPSYLLLRLRGSAAE